MVRRESGNLVPNGRFDIVPPFTAATTANDRVVDGTAGGAHTDKYPSATKQLYRWKMNTYNTTSPSVQYEDGALKVSGIACKERVNLTLAKRIYTDLNEADDIRHNLIPVAPNTSYTVSVRVKTTVTNAVGTPGVYGAMFRLVGHSGTIATEMIRGITSATDNDKIAVTTDWTTYTKTFTTGVATTYINPGFGIYGDSSNYADITAWFDDIVLQKTAVAPRTTATSRTTASNRVAVRDMGTALRFGANTTDRVAIENSAGEVLSSTSVFTVSMFFKKTGQTAATDYLFSHPATVANNRRYISFESDNFLDINMGATKKSGLFKVIKNTWYHLAMVFDATGDAAYAYINGRLVSTQTTFGAIGTFLEDISIGNIGAAGTASFLGLIDEPRIWNRALTADEIQNLYLYGAVPTDGLVAEYLFDEASGTTALDTSGNGNHGTITGATYTTDTPLKPRASI